MSGIQGIKGQYSNENLQHWEAGNIRYLTIKQLAVNDAEQPDYIRPQSIQSFNFSLIMLTPGLASSLKIGILPPENTYHDL